MPTPPPPPPFSGAGLGPQGGARSRRSRQRARGLKVTRAAARDAGLGTAAASPEGGGSPFSSLPCAPSSGARRIFTSQSAPRHLPWASRAERQSRAAPPRPDILGAMAEVGEGRGRGGNSPRRLGPSLGLVTSNSGWPWRPNVSAESSGGPGSAIRGHFEGRGASQAPPATPSELVGAQLRAGGASTSPGWCPLQDLCGEGGAARAVPEPSGHRRLGDCLEPSAGSPSPEAQLEPELARGCRFPTQAPVSSVSVVTPHR